MKGHRDKDFERVLAAAARLQEILPEAVLVGGIPHDLSQVELKHYRRLAVRWRSWGAVLAASRNLSAEVLDRLAREGR